MREEEQAVGVSPSSGHSTMALRGTRFVVERHIGAPPDRVWPVVSDTDGFNRQFLGPVRGAPARTDARPAYRLSMKLGPLTFSWVEYPFSYQVNEGMELQRIYDNGPVAKLEIAFNLRETPDGTHMMITGEATPRWGWATPIVALIMRSSAQQYAAFLDHVEEHLRGVRPSPLDLAAPRLLDPARLARGLDALAQRGVAPEIRAALDSWLRHAQDREVLQMRPLALAALWRTPPRATLSAFLEATNVGITELRWQVLCPNCRVPKSSWRHLAELEAKAHCDSCDIKFGVDFDRLVEARFDVHPAVRAAEDVVYCLSSPQRTPHRLAQADLGVGATTEMVLAAAVPSARVANRTGAAIRVFREEGGPDRADVILSDAPGNVVVGLGAVTLAVHNQLPSRITASLEAESWPSDAATAAQLSTMGEFRRLFSTEVLAPGLQVGIRTITVLFTDLRGSTRYYQDVGDAAAFATVRDHFRLLEEVIEEHEGAIIKTIGDAVMAAFSRPDRALAGAIAMQRRVAEWGRGRVAEPERFLKVGLHEGPVIAVTLNGNLDYFGSTVNLAARVQGKSVGGDIVVSDAMWTPELAALAEGWVVERFSTDLAGFAEPVPLYRLVPAPPEVG